MEWDLPIDGVDVVAESDDICLECPDLVVRIDHKSEMSSTTKLLNVSINDESYKKRRTVLASPADDGPPEPEASRLACLVIT